MKWTKQAEEAVSKVPFFVRRLVRKRVEDEAKRQGGSEVTLEYVQTSRQRFLENMEAEVKGYQLETCFGSGGCPNRAVSDDCLIKDVEALIKSKRLRDFLKTRVQGPLKMHHEFRVSISDCPNACSRPQIADIGIIAAVRPVVDHTECTRCAACAQVCKEDAIRIDPKKDRVEMDFALCVSCGQCIAACPTAALSADQTGYRIQLGGKLGRHPQLGRELSGIFSRGQILDFIDRCLDFYIEDCAHGERFGEIIHRTGLNFLWAGDK